MGGGRKIQLTYANVVATVALFIALGGASYAAVVLPANSVGPTQLRAGAVGPRALSFPLGASSLAEPNMEEIANGACNGPLFPGEPAPPCAPPVTTYTPARHELHLMLSRAGDVSITAVAGLDDRGAAQAAAQVTVRAIVDRRVVSEARLEMAGGQLTQVPVQDLVSLRAGAHTVGLSIAADYSARPETVVVAPVSIIATELPPPP